MQVASASTRGADVRSEIDGRTFEDSDLLVKRSDPSMADGRIFIGHTPAPKNIPHYICILEMLHDGWELLGPPQRETWEADGRHYVQWGWWLQRKIPA